MPTLTHPTARRAAPFALAAALLSACAGPATAPARTGSPAAAIAPGDPAASQDQAAQAAQAFTQLEHRFGAQLGVYALDTGTGRTVTYQAGQRFAFCSTYKALAAAILLKQDTSTQLSQVITYTAADLVPYSPITSRHTGTGMTLDALIAAALDYSDNTAANLLLDQLGGPHGLQTVLRGLGDTTTNLHRTEPDVNQAAPGDTRDTSTARALGTDLRRFVLGTMLPSSRRHQLTSWLLANTTGGPYIRAGVPAGWRVGDKTGNGDWGTRNDIAIAWPPAGAPIVIAVLSRRGSASASSADALIADATRTAVGALRS